MKGIFKDFFDRPIKIRFKNDGNIKDIFISDNFKEEDCLVDVDYDKIEELKRAGFSFDII